MNYYEVLGIGIESKTKDIKKAYLKKIRQYHPDKEPEQFKKIREAYEILSNENTRNEYDERLTLPKWVQKDLNLGIKNKEIGNLNKTIQIYNKILTKYKKLRFIEIALGQVYIENGNSQKAIALFKNILKEDPKNLIIMKLLATAYMARDWYKKGIELCKEIIKHDPEDKVIYFQIATSYMAHRRFEEAEDIILNLLSFIQDDKEEIYSFLMYIEIHLIEHSENNVNNTLDLFNKAKKYHKEFITYLCKCKNIESNIGEVVIISLFYIYQNDLPEGFKEIKKLLKETNNQEIEKIFIEQKDNFEYCAELDKMQQDNRIHNI